MNKKYAPNGINASVTSPNGGYSLYCRVLISIEPNSIAMPIAAIRDDLRTPSLVTRDDAVQNARLNSNAPICFVALNIRL